MKFLRSRVTRILKLGYYLSFPSFLKFLYRECLDSKEPVEVEIGGQRVFLRPNSTDFQVANCIFNFGELHILASQLEPRVILDLGAYIGISALAFAKMFPSALIIAVEPSHENLAVLQMNVANYANIRILPGAVWHKCTTAELFNRNTGESGLTITPSDPAALQMAQNEVQCYTIANIMDRFGLEFVDLIKMDIEGAELDIFRDPAPWIGKVRCLAVELHDRFRPGCTDALNGLRCHFDKITMSGEKVIAFAKAGKREST